MLLLLLLLLLCGVVVLSLSEEREGTELGCWFDLSISRAREARLRQSFRRCGVESRGFSIAYLELEM